MESTITQITIVSNKDAYIRHIDRKNGTSLEIAAFHDREFVIQITDDETALAVNNQKVVLSREEFKALREHINDPDVLKIFA